MPLLLQIMGMAPMNGCMLVYTVQWATKAVAVLVSNAVVFMFTGMHVSADCHTITEITHKAVLFTSVLFISQDITVLYSEMLKVL
jgi:hypothetical protein